DVTHPTNLQVTLGGQVFDHLVYHFVLTYSNWESVTICFSESLESLSEGLQNALWQLGGVPLRHRSDRMSSAVNNLSDNEDFTRRYQALLSHYGLVGEKINAREAHENGDVEAAHRHFKDAVEQALLLWPTKPRWTGYVRSCSKAAVEAVEIYEFVSDLRVSVVTYSSLFPSTILPPLLG